MKKNVTSLSAGEVLKYIRKYTNLSQTEFASKIGRSRDWQYTNEVNKSKYYIDDLILLSKIFNFEIIIKYIKDGRTINFKDYSSSDILKFVRAWSGENQTVFANSINKKTGWQQCNENGKTRYYASDLWELARKHNFVIEIYFKK